MLLLLVTGGILVITVLVGVVVITKATKQDEEKVQIKSENYGTNNENEKEVKSKVVKDNLEEAMLCSDVEIEKAEAEILKACEETLDLSEVKELNKYFSIADEEPPENENQDAIQEEEAIKAIQCQAKEFNRYTAANDRKENTTVGDLKTKPEKSYFFKIFVHRKSNPWKTKNVLQEKFNTS